MNKTIEELREEEDTMIEIVNLIEQNVYFDSPNSHIYEEPVPFYDRAARAIIERFALSATAKGEDEREIIKKHFAHIANYHELNKGPVEWMLKKYLKELEAQLTLINKML